MTSHQFCVRHGFNVVDDVCTCDIQNTLDIQNHTERSSLNDCCRNKNVTSWILYHSSVCNISTVTLRKNKILGIVGQHP